MRHRAYIDSKKVSSSYIITNNFLSYQDYEITQNRFTWPTDSMGTNFPQVFLFNGFVPSSFFCVAFGSFCSSLRCRSASFFNGLSCFCIFDGGIHRGGKRSNEGWYGLPHWRVLFGHTCCLFSLNLRYLISSWYNYGWAIAYKWWYLSNRIPVQVQTLFLL